MSFHLSKSSFHINDVDKHNYNAAVSRIVKVSIFLPQDLQHSDGDSHQVAVLYNAQYRDLVRLVNFQREKLVTQQAELTKVEENMLTRRRESSFYLATVSRHHWSRQITMKIDTM